MNKLKKIIFRIIMIVIILGIILFAVFQIIPYGRNHVNPPVVREPNWDSQETRSIAKRACFACHSNETIWPPYSNIAPISWLVYRDVVEARQKFNFSDWKNAPLSEVGEVREVIDGGEMPPFQYLLLHPEAKLSQAEKENLINGLISTSSR